MVESTTSQPIFIFKFMNELAKALASIKGVVAVGLGGSRGLGLADENSDYDFVLFRSSGEVIPAQFIVDTIKPFTGSADIQVHSYFVMTQVNGIKVEIFQNDISNVAREISLAREGKFRWSIRSLFPHGDLSTCLISHVVHLELCSEMDGGISNLRKLADPFPDLLMHSMIKTFLRQASITVTHASKIKKVADLQYLISLCAGFVFYTNIVIFAANRMYPVLERGGARLILGLPLRPKNYEQRILEVFQASCKGDLQRVYAELTALLSDVRVLANKALEDRKAIEPNMAA